MRKQSSKIGKLISNHYKGESRYYDKTRFGEWALISRKRMDEESSNFLLNLIKGNSVLELGVGTGRYGLILSERGHDFVGIDLSSDMLKKAEEKQAATRIDFRVIRMDAEKLGFHEETFDNVICILTFGFLPNPEDVMKEAYRVLVPGGRFLITYLDLDYLPYTFRAWVNNSRQYGFITLYRYQEVREMFVKSSFNIIQKKRIPGLPFESVLYSIYNLFPERVLREILNRLGKLKENEAKKFISPATLIASEKI